jgi:CubicO group peptidase (beta-lactamase class C family)
MSRDLDKTVTTLEQGVGSGLYPGAQLYVSLRGEPVASLAVGMARDTTPMTTSTLLPWLCCSKVSLALAFGVLWQRGLIEPDTPVADVVAEFADGRKAQLTFRHLLTHTAGLMPDPAVAAFGQGREVTLRAICAADLREDVTPGHLAYYSTMWAFFMIAEAIERLDGRPARAFVAEEVFAPLQVTETLHGLDPAAYARHRSRLGALYCHSAKAGGLIKLPQLSKPEHFDRYQPGLDVVGPARELGRLVEALLPDRTPRLVEPHVRDALTSRHRVGLYDPHYGSYVSWGLGLMVDGWAFGRYCSPSTFGHSGMRTSFVMADPECGLVVAAIANAMTPTPQASIGRDLRVVDAVYRDLGLATLSRPSPRVAAPTADRLPDWVAIAEQEDLMWEVE